jgi:hypothetical protein
VRKRTRKEVLKNQRRELNHYFIVSGVYYIFCIILAFCLIPISVAIKDQKEDFDITGNRLTNHVIFMIFFFLLGAGSLSYLVRRIHWLLIEIEEELRYNANRTDADEVFRDENNDVNTTQDRFENNLLAGNKGGAGEAKKPEGSYHLRNQMM